MAQKNIIKRIISNPLIQTFLIYVSGGWIALEITDYIINNYGLSDKVRDVLSILLLIGLPIAIFLAWFLSREKEESKEELVETSSDKKSQGILKTLRKKPWFSIPGSLILILLIVAGIKYTHRMAKVRWAMEEALPGIEYLINDNNFSAAFHLVQKAGRFIADDPDFIERSSEVIAKVTIITDPPGAEVYIKEYAHHDSEWESIGETPLDSIELPNRSFYQMRFEKTGYDTVQAVAATSNDTLFRKLFEENTIPLGMVYVEGYWDEVKNLFLTDKRGFFIDRFEVTNRQYKEFIDQGGYADPRFWENEFIKDGVTLSWKEAMAVFTDKTGRPGPASWEASDYPEGRDDYPVSGVSWYEAAAYAEWAGKALPTGDHWDSGAGFHLRQFLYYFGSKLLPISNFNGKGPEPVGSHRGINIFGTYDMAGNVREWCWNNYGEGRIISGGAWDDANYVYTIWSQLPPFDRSPENGFRCVQYIDSIYIPASAFRQIELGTIRDYSNETPVSEEIFKIFKNQFLYDSLALESNIEDRDESHDDWIIEKISFNAAYGNERVIAYLYLPKNANPPFQTLIFFPGGYAFYETDLLTSSATNWFFDYLLKNGRAVMYPVYKGTYERNDGLGVIDGQSHQCTERRIIHSKDFSRCIDYLDTRPDIDTSKIAFYGHSLGGNIGMIIPAIEDRIKLSISIAGGLPSYGVNPEIDRINYLPRITTPVMMLNGRYDTYFPFETSIIPMYDLLGTLEEDKYLHIYETTHFVPKNEMIKETLNFLDQYFGPVNK